MAGVKELPKNRSSPDFDLVISAGDDAELLGDSVAQRKQSQGSSVDTGSLKSEDTEVVIGRKRLAESINSSVSIQSSITLTGTANLVDNQEEGEEEGVESDVTTPMQKVPHSSLSSSEVNTSREESAGTIHSDMSGSCSTLQNERADGEIESSVEQVSWRAYSCTIRKY